MKIPCVEEYQKQELKAMPHIAQMLFPDEPDKNPNSKADKKVKKCHQHLLELESLELESQQIYSEKNNLKFINPKLKDNISNYRLRRGWLARRSFIAMEEIHIMVFNNAKKLYDEAQMYIFSKFRDYLTRHGGWMNIVQDTSYDCMEDMLSMTFKNASKGFLAGHVLKYCLENNCNTEEASEHVAETVVIEYYDEFMIDDCEFFPELENFKIYLARKKYNSGYIRQIIWNEMKNVAYAWAAAVDIFGDASSFTNRMVSLARPFEFKNFDTPKSTRYDEFVSLAKHYYLLATSKRRSPKRALPPLIKKPHPFLFD